MPNEELHNYIKSHREAGTPDDQIKQELRNAGWQESDITEAFLGSALPNAIPGATGKFKHKKIVLLIAVLLGAFIAVGVVFGYQQFFNSPERVLAGMLKGSSEIKSFGYDLELRTTYRPFNLPNQALLPDGSLEPAQQDNSEVGTIVATLTGKIDSNDIQNPKSEQSLTLVMSDKEEKNKSTYGLEAISYSKISYFRITDAPDDGFVSSFIGPLKNQWFKIDSKEGFGIPGLGGLPEQTEEQKATQGLDEEKIAQIKEALKESKAIKITGKLKGERINGRSTHHYGFALDNQGLTELFANIEKIISGSSAQNEELISEDDFSKVFQSITGEIWIDKKELWPLKITMVMSPNEEGTLADDILLTMNFKDINQAVEIAPPAEARSIQEILQGIYGGSSAELAGPEAGDSSYEGDLFEGGIGSARAKSRDARRLADMKSIQVAILLRGKAPSAATYKQDLSPEFLTQFPTDPSSGQDYFYGNEGADATYFIKFNTEVDGSLGPPGIYCVNSIKIEPSDRGWCYEK